MPDRNVLGEFLRARRQLVTPATVGLPDGGGRRVPGLRREEVALLAGVSADYYTRLEQGRERHPSEQVLSAVARALCLDEPGAAHLLRIARPHRANVAAASVISPYLEQLLHRLDDTPACVVGPAMDVLALNRMGEALYSAFARRDNLLRMVFLDPAAPSFYIGWESTIPGSVSNLRAMAGQYPDDPRIAEIIAELCANSPAFRELWARHDVRPKTAEDKRFCHPEVGELTLHYEAFAVTSAPGQQLFTYQAAPGSPSESALELLRKRAEIAEKRD